MTYKDLKPSEYNAFYQTYINKTNKDELTIGLKENKDSVIAFFKSIPLTKLAYRYAEDKWTIKDVIQHLIDTERIFAYRALRIARHDRTPLAGFDQDAYVLPSKSNERTFESLMAEYIAVRQATITLFESFDEGMLMEMGMASGSPMSVRAVGFIIMGHENHHCEIIKERYL